MKDQYLGANAIINLKKEYQIPCSYHFYQDPPQFVRGKMQHLYDSQGKEYLDFFSGVSVMNCGHSNDLIIDRISEQIKTLQHTTTIFLTQPIVELAKELAGVLPGNLKRSFFCMSGSEANEGALLLSKLYTGKTEFIYLNGGLHGRTHLTMSVTGIDMWRSSPDIAPGTHRADGFYPDVLKGDFDHQNAMEVSLRSIEKILHDRKDKIAALIVEPIQGNGGVLTPHKDYFKRLLTLLHQHGALLIVDEVQTGFARTGKMFAIENFGVVPDIMTMAKALGNGQPIAAFSSTDEIASSFTTPSASTLGGNPVSSTAALAVLDYIKDNSLMDKSRLMGEYLREGLSYLKDHHPLIRDVRGIGLMMGMELAEGNAPATEKTDQILEKMKDKGVIIGKNGFHRNVLAFQPPLIINKSDIDKCVNELDLILKTI
ncbi:MAG: aspartate aminotransferase family protein [Eubacteriaceae bacterium]|nr:aspartate aminotransferase family protein [Eubacteriaceae bacterium]